MADENPVAVVEAPPEATPEVRPELTSLTDKVFKRRAPSSRKAASEIPPVASEPVAASPEIIPAAKPAAPEPSSDAPSLPSFLRESLQPPAAAEPEKPKAPPELPEDFAAAETDPKKKADLGRFRDEYKKRGDEITRLQTELTEARQSGDKPSPETEAKVKQLEEQNSMLAARVGVENHPDFKALLGTRQKAVAYAQHTLKDLGVDPAGVAKVLTSTGKDRYEAIDDLTRDLPQSARDELSNVFRAIRGFDDQIIGARKNYGQTFEALQKRDLEAGQQAMEAEKQNWGKTFDSLWSTMRDKSGVEVFRKSDDPKDTEWNARVDAMQENARRIVLDNDDPAKLIAAVQLGHAADAYRSLFYATRDALIAERKRNAGITRSTPTITPDIGVDRDAEPEIKPGDRSRTLGRLGVEFLEKHRNKS